MASRAVKVALLLAAVATTCALAQLHEKFYGETCPSVEDVVRKEMGCDGSVLLDSANKTAEKDTQPNQTLRGFGFVERVKAAVEKACPDTVSCADILALIARDAVWLVSRVPGHFANDTRVHFQRDRRSATPTPNFTVLTQLFAAVNLDAKDLVVLSAGHTIGTSHCFSFSDWLYNFTGMENPSDIDPTLEPQYMMRLKSKCASLNDNTTLVEMDPGSFKTFDTDYFKLVSKRRGLFHSDGALLTDPFTRAYVQRHATGAFKNEFFAHFADSMIKMGNANPLTGSQGEIRKKCSVVNH
ncbi:hypothetical protein CFC21_008038 [Triticum aestivum]|uniref:Peroxidase n=2 Tax=Triticum aestivum TaxID=4565 RepID=A0A3B5Z2G1_WHEAT|nr:hypothetical protein CFC21_008038 [Triticum aestivum]